MKNNLNVRILVCCHKKDIMATQLPYFPIQVGKAVSKENLNIQGDDAGDNISSKNSSYCELTGMYWAWKNLKNVDVIGLCHYRRYFDFHNQCRLFMPFEYFSTSKFKETNLNIPNIIIDRVFNGQIVVAKSIPLLYNLAINYCIAHVSEDLRTLQHVIKETQDRNVEEAFDVVMYHSNALIHYNMFLMSWKDFDNYCNWLFPILQEVEKRIDISNYNSVQRRIFGYMAERLFNVWLVAEKKVLISKPVICFCDISPSYMNPIHFFTYNIRSKINALIARSNSWF